MYVGYRVRDEIVFYLINNMNALLLTEDEAFDNSIMQKILPRIQGSSASIKTMLRKLFESLSGQKLDANATDTATAATMQKIVDDEKAKYLKSTAKIAFMVCRFEEDGFTSFCYNVQRDIFEGHVSWNLAGLRTAKSLSYTRMTWKLRSRVERAAIRLHL